MTYPKLYLYKAKHANIIAILRRGTVRNEWELIRWDLDTDTFTEGQWLKKKVMNGKHCSISPNGLYFAYHYDEYKNNGYSYSNHSIVSKIPNFTAVYYKSVCGYNWATEISNEDGTVSFVDWNTERASSEGYINFETIYYS